MLANVTGTVYVNAATATAATEYARELANEMTRLEPRLRVTFVSDARRQDRRQAHEVDVNLLLELDGAENLHDVRGAIADASADATATLASDHGTFALALWGKIDKIE